MEIPKGNIHDQVDAILAQQEVTEGSNRNILAQANNIVENHIGNIDRSKETRVVRLDEPKLESPIIHENAESLYNTVMGRLQKVPEFINVVMEKLGQAGQTDVLSNISFSVRTDTSQKVDRFNFQKKAGFQRVTFQYREVPMDKTEKELLEEENTPGAIGIWTETTMIKATEPVRSSNDEAKYDDELRYWGPDPEQDIKKRVTGEVRIDSTARAIQGITLSIDRLPHEKSTSFQTAA